MSEWLFNDEPFTEIPKGYEGFVYRIEELDTGKKYIGRKYFTSKRKPAKTKKNENTARRRVTKESDWKEYWSSSDYLKEQVLVNGIDNYKREILVICKTRGDCNRMETYYLWKHNVLDDPNYYNESIGNVKAAPDHIKKSRIYTKK